MSFLDALEDEIRNSWSCCGGGGRRSEEDKSGLQVGSRGVEWVGRGRVGRAGLAVPGGSQGITAALTTSWPK